MLNFVTKLKVQLKVQLTNEQLCFCPVSESATFPPQKWNLLHFIENTIEFINNVSNRKRLTRNLLESNDYENLKRAKAHLC